MDQPFENDSATSNLGFNNRSTYFRKGRSLSGEFRAEGATFIGKLSKKIFQFCRVILLIFVIKLLLEPSITQKKHLNLLQRKAKKEVKYAF